MTVPAAVTGPDPVRLAAFAGQYWQDSVLPELEEYIRIPCKSPLFDPDWQTNGHIDAAMARVVTWLERQAVPGMRHEILRLPGRTPLLFIEVAGQADHSVLLYGHLDKQPEMNGWRAGLGPWTPVLEGERLYGRGGADDGYALFACLTALLGLAEQKIPHGRCLILIESSEESGSPDLPAYITHLAERIADPDLVICLDSCCGNYQQLWCSTSLRGMIGGRLQVEILDEAVHSGDAGGVVPCTFRILRQVLGRLEDSASGEILLPECHVEIPPLRVQQAERAAEVLGDDSWQRFPFLSGTRPVVEAALQLILNRSWRSSLSVTGADHFPAIADAGNVLRPASAIRLSLRLPPTARAGPIAARLREVLEADPPHRARVQFDVDCMADGWHAVATAPWLDELLQRASGDFFARPAMYMGEGVSIPFMNMLSERFPDTQFLVTGVLGPHSNAHGANEFLHLGMAKKLSCCIAAVLAGHYQHYSRGI